MLMCIQSKKLSEDVHGMLDNREIVKKRGDKKVNFL